MSAITCLNSVGSAIARCLVSLPVILVLLLIATDWYSFVIDYSILHHDDRDYPIVTAFLCILFTLLLVLTIWSYFRTIMTSSSVRDNPPPADYYTRYRVAHPDQPIRVCARCRGQPKPLRAHHCSICGECILKMDHHCPWVANCFPESDTRVLTNHGFLFLDEIEALEEAGRDVLYGCYDKERRQLQYSTGDLVIPKQPPPYLVEFTGPNESGRWAKRSGPYGGDGLHKKRETGKNPTSGHVSLRVTPDHDMFVQTGYRQPSGGAVWDKVLDVEEPHHKEPAKSLLQDDGPELMRLLACAEKGYQPQDTDRRDATQAVLGLTDEQWAAFIELFGFWLGDGTMGYQYHSDKAHGGRDCVRFIQRKKTDLVWLKEMFVRVGLSKDHYKRKYEYKSKLTARSVTEPCWFLFFDQEFGRQYKRSRYYTPPPSHTRSLFTFTSRPSSLSVDSGKLSSASSTFTPRRRSTASTDCSTPHSASGSRRSSLSISQHFSFSRDAEQDDADMAAAIAESLSLAANDVAPMERVSVPVPSLAGSDCLTCGNPLGHSEDEYCDGCLEYMIDHPTAPNEDGAKIDTIDFETRDEEDEKEEAQMGHIERFVRTGGWPVTARREDMTVSYADGERVGSNVSSHVVKYSSMPPLEADPEAAMDTVEQQRQQQQSASDDDEMVVKKEEDRPIKDEPEEEKDELMGGDRDEENDDEKEEDEEDEEVDEDEGSDDNVIDLTEDDEEDDGDQAQQQPPPGVQPPPIKWTKSVKWIPQWMMAELSRDEMRLLIRGLHRADGSFKSRDVKDKKIYTSSATFRDQLMQALLHCGYTASTSVVYRAGAIRGYVFHDQSIDHNTYSVEYYNDLSPKKKLKYRPIQATVDKWMVTWSDMTSRVGSSVCMPPMPQNCVTRVPYSRKRDGRTWCVTVDHDDHLIIAQRAQRDHRGIVTKQSRPIITGNCIGFKNYKFFVLFLFYATLSSYLYQLAGISLVIAVFTSTELNASLVSLLAAIITGSFAFALTFFTLFHLSLVLSGQTTIEVHAARTGHTDQPDHDSSGSSDGSGGGTWKENWVAVFGPDWQGWLLPVDSVRMSGYEYDFGSEGDGEGYGEEVDEDVERGLMRQQAASDGGQGGGSSIEGRSMENSNDASEDREGLGGVERVNPRMSSVLASLAPGQSRDMIAVSQHDMESDEDV